MIGLQVSNTFKFLSLSFRSSERADEPDDRESALSIHDRGIRSSASVIAYLMREG
jgi:hypothetical protein